MSNIISETKINDYFSKARTLKKDLGKDDFFQLMIEQLKNQDPTQPSNDLNQILNTATFGILEGVNSIRDAVANNNTNVFNYTNLVGKEITYEKVTTDPLTNERTVTKKSSVVQGVSLEGDKILLKVDDGIVYPDEIKEMNFEGQDKKQLVQDTMAYFSLVGKNIDYTVDGVNGAPAVTKNGVVDSVVMKNGVIEFTVGSDKFTMDKITGVYNALQTPTPTSTDSNSTTDTTTTTQKSDRSHVVL